MSTLAWATMVLFLGAPVHARETTAWQHHAAPNFGLISDLPSDEAAAIVANIELFEQVAARYLDITPNADAPPLNLLVFSKRKDFARLVNRRHFAAFTQPGLADTLLVIGPNRGASSLLANTLHEYTHYLLRTQKVGYPIWYEEGVATVLATSRFDRANASVTLGRLANFQPPQPNMPGPPGIRSLVETRNFDGWSGKRMAKFYQASAELVHFFLFGPQRDRPDYRAALQAYFAERHTDLFSALNTSESQLARQWQSYLSARRLPVATLDVTPASHPIESRPLTSAEVSTWQARAAEIINPRQAAVLYESLIAQEPDILSWRVDLARVLADIDLDRADSTLAQALSRGAQGPAVKVQQANLLTRRCRLRADMACLSEWQNAARLLREALTQDPNRHDAIFQLGIAELYTGNPGRAVNYLRIAHKRVPWSPKVNLQLGECLRLLGNSQAERHLRQARDWAYSDGVRTLADAGLELIHAGTPN